MTWPNVAIGDIFEVARGGSPRPIDQFITDDPEGLNWVMIGDASASGKVIQNTKKRIRPEGLKKTRAVKPGDFILSNSMSFGRPYIMGIEGCIHDGWLLLRPRGKNVDPDYFYHLLGSQTVYAKFSSRAAGATVKNLNSDIVRNVSIRLPPLKEQKRIAAILDQADALRRLRARALDKLNTLGQAVFHEMFGAARAPAISARAQLPDLPEGWTWQLLTNVAELATGHTPDRKITEYWDGDVSWLSLKEIRGFDGKEVRSTELKISELGLKNSSAVRLPKNTVCLSRTASVGFVALMAEEMATSQDFVNWVCGPDLNPRYLMQAMIASRDEIKSLATGSTHRTIYFPTAKQFKVLVPPKSLQDEFVTRISQIGPQQRVTVDATAQAEKLFVSLQHNAFRGEL